VPHFPLTHGAAAAPTPPSVEPAAALSGAPPLAPSARRLRSAELFGSKHEIEIEHGQAIYRLRLTSLGKLILTK
jgi:hemin uptake protein HemP